MPGKTWNYDGYAERQVEGLYAKACIETDRLIHRRAEANEGATSEDPVMLDQAVIRAKARERSWASVCERLGLKVKRRNSDRQAS